MTDLVRSFRDLEAYRTPLALAVDIHALTKMMPPDERYVLASQMHRASHSVCQNIAEAWRKRRYEAAFVAKLSDAETEAGEMQCCLDIALRLNYLDQDRHAELDARYEQVLGKIVRMITGSSRWCTL